jgi:hypothetical protein
VNKKGLRDNLAKKLKDGSTILVTTTVSPGNRAFHELVKLAPAVGRLARHLLAEDPLAASRLQGLDLGSMVLGVG